MSNTNGPAVPPGRLTLQRAKQALVRWYFLPLGLALVAALAGGLAAGLTRPTAEALVSLNTDQMDATGMARASETMVREMRTDAVFNEASRTLGDSSDPLDLRDRTRIAAVQSTMVISVQVVASDPGQAAVEADAIVTAVQKIEQDARDAELERVTTSIRQLMSSPDAKVGSKEAEQTRITRLGGALADGQASVATMATQLTIVQHARAMSATIGPFTLAMACAIGGALLGGGVALLLGARRGGVRSLAELEELYPQLPAIAPDLLSDVLAVEGDGINTILVSGTAATRERLTHLRDRIAVQLLSHPAAGRDLNLLAAPLSEAVVRRVRTDPGVVLVVGVDPSTVRLEELGDWLDRLSSRAYLVELPGSV